MLDSKFFFTLVGLIVAVFAICNTNMSPSINEGFWGNSGSPRTVKVIREVHPRGPDGKPGRGGYSLQNNYQSMLGNEKYVSRPSFQGILSPRFSNVDYGANIRYNMPSYANQGSPCDALAMGDMAKEGYHDTRVQSRENVGCNKGSCGGGCGDGCGVAKCGKGGVSLGGQFSNTAPPAMSSDPNFQAAMNKIHNFDHTQSVVTDGLVPVGDMTTINALGAVEQPIVYDRYIYANQKSRLYAHGDPIRGDLPITPSGGNWFSVHPHPNIDLNPGAMNVMGGFDNATSRAMAELINATSGGYDKTIAGVDLNMVNQFSTNVSAAGGDIHVTAFA